MDEKTPVKQKHNQQHKNCLEVLLKVQSWELPEQNSVQNQTKITWGDTELLWYLYTPKYVQLCVELLCSI